MRRRNPSFLVRHDSYSRGARRPKGCVRRAPLQTEGTGKTGCALHPRSRVQWVEWNGAHEHTGSAESIRPSLRNGFTAYNVLSPVIGLACHRRRRKLLSADLTPGSGRQDHTISPSAPVLPELSPVLVRPGKFQRRQLAAPSVYTPHAAHEVHLALRLHCAPDAVASIASHRALVRPRNAPRSGETGESLKVICPNC